MKKALLVVDVQSTFFDMKPYPFDAKTVLKNINLLTGWARQSEHLVIFIQHERADSAVEYGCSGWQLSDSLVSHNSDVFVRKTTPDSFLKTNLEKVLNQHDIEQLIVTGYASEFCVDTTVRRAASLGYAIDLVSDAHTTDDKPHASGDVIRQHHTATLSSI